MPLKKYVLDNAYYLFPDTTHAVDYDDRLVVYVGGRAVDSIEPYRVERDTYLRKRNFEYLIPAVSDCRYYADQYENVRAFILRRPSMSNLQFDSAVCEDMILFSFFPNIDLPAIDSLIERISKTMPFIMNIFLRPVIHLHSEEFIVPVEAVKKIDQRTVQHILQHSEHWKTLEDDGRRIKPARLLTTLYEDDYTIYENRVFCRTMDQVIAVLKRFKNIFTDIIYNKISFDLSVGDKSNHLYHYLALGKLYVGYVKSDELFAERCAGYTETFDRFIQKISAQRIKPVYKKNRRLKIGKTVHKTNILAMHKDYRHIFKLKQILDKREEPVTDASLMAFSAAFIADYGMFCNMLTVFAITHFRFQAEEKPLFHDGSFLGADFDFSKWHITLTPLALRSAGLGATALRVCNGTAKHTTLLIPYPANLSRANYPLLVEMLKDIAKEVPCDNYVFFTPAKSEHVPTYFSNTPISFGILPLSVNDINSFKRIQKLVMIAMFKTAKTNDICPFCGGHFEREPEGGYFCFRCKTELVETVCPRCNTPFQFTSARYPHLSSKVVAARDYTAENRWKYCCDKDAQLNYRNITDLTPTGTPVCPHCNKGLK